MSSSAMARTGRLRGRRLWSAVAGGILALALASTAMAGLVNGSLPAAAFTYLATTVNDVNMTGNGIHLKTKGAVNVKTTYTRAAPTGALLGWHYHNGPVVVSVTVGTITYLDGACRTWDLRAGESYIESTGEVLNAYLDPTKNNGLANVEWFTTRLYPAGTGDPVEVPAPCSL
jgi:hypothetical protein